MPVVALLPLATGGGLVVPGGPRGGLKLLWLAFLLAPRVWLRRGLLFPDMSKVIGRMYDVEKVVEKVVKEEQRGLSSRGCWR